MTDGSVIIIGGAEDKVRDRVILSRFVTLAGGRDATVAVISTASSLGQEAGDRNRQVFGELGVNKVRTIHAVTRPQANDETAALGIRDATGIFMTGCFVAYLLIAIEIIGLPVGIVFGLVSGEWRWLIPWALVAVTVFVLGRRDKIPIFY